MPDALREAVIKDEAYFALKDMKRLLSLSTPNFGKPVTTIFGCSWIQMCLEWPGTFGDGEMRCAKTFFGLSLELVPNLGAFNEMSQTLPRKPGAESTGRHCLAVEDPHLLCIARPVWPVWVSGVPSLRPQWIHVLLQFIHSLAHCKTLWDLYYQAFKNVDLTFLNAY